MWIMTSYGILMPADLPSEHRPVGVPVGAVEWDMQVRSRDRTTLVRLRRRMKEAGFTTSGVRDTWQLDYEYRVYVRRNDFATFIAGEVQGIDYAKFKPSVLRRGGGGRVLHDLYERIWYVVADHYDSAVLRWERERGARSESGISHE